MQPCSHFEQLIIDYFYDELDPDQIEAVEKHVQECESCAAALKALRQLGEHLPQNDVPEPDQATLNLLRTMTSLRLKNMTAELPRRKIISWIPQIAFGFCLLLLGYFAGQSRNIPQQSNSQDFIRELIMATNEVKAQNTAIDPFLLNIKKINYDEGSGNVEIEYNTINDIRIKGDLYDSDVMGLLQQALLEEENTTVRLHAVKAIRSMSSESEPSTSMHNFVDVFEQMMENEPNMGVRYQIVQALKYLPWSDELKSLLMKTVVDQKDNSLRVEAFRTLVRRTEEPREIEGLLQKVKNDSTTFIRVRAQKMLDQLNDSEPNSPVELKREVGQ